MILVMGMQHRTTSMEGRFYELSQDIFYPTQAKHLFSFPLRRQSFESLNLIYVYFSSICHIIKACSLVCYPQESTKNQSTRLLRLAFIPSLSGAPPDSVQILSTWFPILFQIFPLFCYELKYPIKRILPSPFQTFLSALWQYDFSTYLVQQKKIA